MGVTGLESAPVVVRVVRGEFVESVHHAIGVVTGPDGAVSFAVGDPATPIFPRSALKPLQAVAALRAGAAIGGRELAVACASHSGEPQHFDAVRSLLASCGLTEADLANTPGLPTNEAAQWAWLRSGRGRESIVQNCSGNHAAMLAACVAAGWGLGDYLAPEHPHQRLVADVVAELVGSPVLDTAVDGCGAPVFAVPLVGLARAFGRLATATSGPEREVADAMRAFPELVGGTGRDVTTLMQAVPGLVAKDGAEGVYAAGLPDGTGVALKVTDGADRARVPVMAELLRRTGMVADDVLDAWATSPVLGHGRVVGGVEADLG